MNFNNPDEQGGENKNHFLGEHINLKEKDIFSLTEQDLLDAGEGVLENRKQMMKTLGMTGISQDKKESLSELFPSNEILNEIRRVKKIVGIQRIKDWEHLPGEEKKAKLEQLGITIPSDGKNKFVKLVYNLQNEEKNWIDAKFYSYIKQLTESYETDTKTEVKK